MKSLILKFLKKPFVFSTLLAILLLIIIWAFSPMIKYNGTAILSSVIIKSILSAIIILFWLADCAIQLYRLHKQQKLTAVINFFNNIPSYAKFYSKKTQSFTKEKKQQFITKNQRKQFIKKPWYLVMGEPQSGKSTLISHVLLNYTPPTELCQDGVKLNNNFPDEKFWFSEQANIIEHSLLDNDESLEKNYHNQNWNKLIKTLLKQNKSKPLTGIIITYNISQLILATANQKQAYLSRLASHLRDIYKICRTQIPLYLVLTKCDQVQGFTDYFSDIDAEQLSQVFGVTMPLDIGTDINKSSQYFVQQYDKLISKIEQRTLFALDREKHFKRRENIFEFSRQMQLFANPIDLFLCEIFGSLGLHNVIHLRGVYFSSGTQTGEHYDFLGKHLSDKYQLSANNKIESTHQPTSFFTNAIFSQIILKDSKILGFSDKAKRRLNYASNAIKYGTPAAVMITLYMSYMSYQYNKENLVKLQQYITTHNKALKLLPAHKTDLQQTAAVLNNLYLAKKMYDSSSYFMIIDYNRKSIHHHINSAINREVNQLLLPRIATIFEHELHKTNNSTELYSYLKGYLAFSNINKSPASDIKIPIKNYIAKTLPSDLTSQHQINYYVDIAAKQTILALPLDQQLIVKSRNQLAQVVPSKRAFSLLLLESHSDKTPDYSFAEQQDSKFHKVFDNHNASSSIAAIYTYNGFENIYLKNIKTISSQVVADNHIVGLKENTQTHLSEQNINQQINHQYQQAYQQQWMNYLNNLNIKKFKNIDQALTAISILSNNQSPIHSMLATVHENTSKVENDNIHIADKFSKINDFYDGKNKKYNLANMDKTLISLHDYLLKISQQPDLNLAELKAAKQFMSGDLNNPIRKLLLEAKHAPAPINQWLTSIANNSWDLIIHGAGNAINDAWDNQVYPQFKTTLKNYYPLDSHSQNQASLGDFEAFFSSKGQLQQFFNKYLSAFIDTSKNHWHLYPVSGAPLAISAENIAAFKRLHQIQQLYFSEKSTMLALDFAILPRNLDSNAKSVNLTISNKSIVYQHGPQQQTSIHWPGSSSVPTASVRLTGFNDQHYGKSYSGPWAIYQLFDHSQLRHSPIANHLQLNMNLSNHRANFDIVSTIPLAKFKLEYIKGYSLPEKLIQ